MAHRRTHQARQQLAQQSARRAHALGMESCRASLTGKPKAKGAQAPLTRIGRLLDEEVGGPAQQIRAVQILDRVEDGAAPHELGEPGKQQVRFMAQIALERPARPPLERLEPPPQLRGLRLGHDTDREDAALLPILFDLVRRQTLRHRSSQEWRAGANRITTTPWTERPRSTLPDALCQA